MSTELRHCVYCRRAKRECDVVIAPRILFKRGRFTIKCKICGAEGSYEKTSEEAKITWNHNTATVADVELLHTNALTAVRLGEVWKNRAMVNLELSEDLTSLLNEVRLLIENRATEIVAEYRADSKHGTENEDAEGVNDVG